MASRVMLVLWSALIVAAAVASAPSVADVLPIPKRLAEDREDTRAALASIRLEDGLSQEEAQIVASVYFYNYVGACGGAFHAREAAGGWAFAIVTGAAGAYSGDLRIQASRGRITMDGEVLFSSLEEFRRDVVDQHGRRFWSEWLRHGCPLGAWR